ncbi:MAG: RpiB/LacA/LacB family sugar-phosphate isomerase [Microcystaceae cyanobacterium]
MKIAIASDEKTYLTDYVVKELCKRDFEVILLGILNAHPLPWTTASEKLAQTVAQGQADYGVLFCYTGTGASIVANKVQGIRAALCGDAATAQGARRWNDANVLVISLRATTPDIAKEILDAWFSTDLDAEEKERIEEIAAIERRMK